MKKMDGQAPAVIVDYSHMGRKITGIERISAELFSPEALAGIGALHTRPASALGMIREQWLTIPYLAGKFRNSILLFPGFPPCIIVSALFNKRVVPYIHDLFLLERKAELNVRARTYMRPSFIYALKKLKRFFVNSETTAAKLRCVVAADAHIWTLRPRAANIFGFSKIERFMPPPGEELRVVMLGTVEPRKNYIFAAELTEKLSISLGRPVALHISGREGWGGEVDNLKQYAHVKYHGYLSTESIRELVSSCHLFMSTSHDEGLGLPLLEVLYSGIPMVVSDIPVYREVAERAGAIFISNSCVDAACEKIVNEIDDNLFSKSVDRSISAINNWNDMADGDSVRFAEFISASNGK